MKTTFSRTFFSFALILFAALLSVGLFFQMLAKRYLTDQAINSLKNNSTTISQLASAYYTDNRLSDQDFLVNLSLATNISNSNAVICDATGKLLMCSDAPLGCEHQGMTITSQRFLQRILTQEYVVSNGVIDGLYEEDRKR